MRHFPWNVTKRKMVSPNTSVLNKALYVECFGANATLIDSLDFLNPTYTAVLISEAPNTLVCTSENLMRTQTNSQTNSRYIGDFIKAGKM